MIPASEPGTMHALGATIALVGSVLVLAFAAFFAAVAAGWIR